MVLDATDLSAGYSIKEKSPRLKSDASNDALSLGWQEGYYIRFAHINTQQLDSSIIEQYISKYPTENITMSLDLPKQSDENNTYEELPSPNIEKKVEHGE
ncbi:hypothetical protein HZB00_01280 [Candidatus Woesearchaeota archaeon]|nr:hypothetical protein [Candidatus Woesearchaeota archaeon]